MEQTNSSKQIWKPLVLVIPLRLGISSINPAYVQGVKVSNIMMFYYYETRNINTKYIVFRNLEMFYVYFGLNV